MQFLKNIEEIRARARRQIEDGPVTKDYQLDREQAISILNEALATELDLSLGDLLEGIVLHAFEGKAPFSAPTLRKIRALRAVYGLDLTAKDSHRMHDAVRRRGEERAGLPLKKPLGRFSGIELFHGAT